MCYGWFFRGYHGIDILDADTLDNRQVLLMAVYYNEIDKFCCAWIRELIKMGMTPDGEIDNRSIADVSPDDLKGFTQCHFFAGIGGWAYALKLAGWPENKEVWTGSCPCFPKDTLIHTREGLLPIQDITVGMYVLTHKKRWRKVLRTGSDLSKATVIVKGQGHYGLECTPNHPFFTPENEWIPAEKMVHRRWINICEQPHIPIPIPYKDKKGWIVRNGRYRVCGWVGNKCIYLGTCSSEADAIQLRSNALHSGIINVRGADAVDVTSNDFAYFLGRYIGDGWTTGNSIILCDSFDKEKEIINTMSAAGMCVSISRERTNIKARCGSQWLSQYLIKYFGKYSYAKKLPAWLLSAPIAYVKQFLQGWKDSDGNLYKNCWTINTVSKQLAIGLKFLLLRLGYAPSISFTNGKPTYIEGRLVHARDYISVSWHENSRTFKFVESGGAGLVRKVLPGMITTVYNLEVDEDNSYVADGIIVHNCQPFSSAGMRKGVDDERHLWPEFYRLISARRPITVIGEQVSGKDARAWWDIVYNDLEKAGYARGAINTCACSTGAPHIRQRLYWMAHSGSIRYGGRGEGGSSWFGQSVQAEGLCTAGELANPAELRCGSYTEGAAIQGQCAERGGEYTQSEYAWKLQERFKRCGRYGELGDSQCEGLERQSESERGAQGRQEQTGCTVNAGDVIGGVENAYKPRCEEAMQDGFSWDKRPSGSSRCPMPTNGFWANPDWLWCRDKKWRPIESGIIPLASRLSKGMVPGRDCRAIRQRLKGYGNAIVIPQAVEFIKCVMEIIDD